MKENDKTVGGKKPIHYVYVFQVSYIECHIRLRPNSFICFFLLRSKNTYTHTYIGGDDGGILMGKKYIMKRPVGAYV